MKIRYGFVSNSSSTSFVLAIKQNKNACPCCGRSDPDLLDLIQNRAAYGGETEVLDNTFEEVLATLQKSLDEYKKMKSDFALMYGEDKERFYTPPYYTYENDDNKVKVGDTLDYYDEIIKLTEEFILKVKKYDDPAIKVARVSIAQTDSNIENILHEMVKNGSVTIIEEID